MGKGKVWKWAMAMGLLLLAAFTGTFALFRQNSGQSHLNLANVKPVGIPTHAEKRAVFQKVWGIFNSHYPSFQIKSVNWEHEKNVYEPQALAAKTWPAFFLVISDMIFTLHDAHCGIIGAPLPPLYGPLILTHYVDNQVVVAEAPGNPLIKSGMIIEGVDGHPTSDILNHPAGPLSHFSPLSFQTLNLLTTRSLSPELLALYNPLSLRVQNIAVPVYGEEKLRKLWTDFFAQRPNLFNNLLPLIPQIQYYANESTNKSIQIRHLNSGIIWMVIPTMSIQQDPQLYTQFTKAIGQIRSAKGLIVAIRNNEGGDMWPGAWFAQHFYTSVQEPLEFRGLRNVQNRLLKTDVIPGDAFTHVKLSNPRRSSPYTPWLLLLALSVGVFPTDIVTWNS